jgi:hypothetical protein
LQQFHEIYRYNRQSITIPALSTSRGKWTASLEILSDMQDKGSHMAYRFISRERFRESSIAGGLAVSLGSGGAPLYEAASVTAPGTMG